MNQCRSFSESWRPISQYILLISAEMAMVCTWKRLIIVVVSGCSTGPGRRMSFNEMPVVDLAEASKYHPQFGGGTGGLNNTMHWQVKRLYTYIPVLLQWYDFGMVKFSIFIECLVKFLPAAFPLEGM